MQRKFVINPRAGGGRSGRRAQALRDRFSGTSLGFDHVLPGDRLATIEQTRRALHAGYEQIVAVGGDGTINAVVNGFFENGAAINSRAQLCIVDAGTGSDYVRAVYGTRAHDWCACIESPQVQSVDVGRIVSVGTGRAALYFVNMASVGLSADVVLRKQAMPAFLPGVLSYAFPAFAALFRARPFETRIELDGAVHEGEILNLFVAKGVTAGSGMRLGGAVTLSDGAFDVTVVKAMSLVRALPSFVHLFDGRFDDERRFIKTTASCVVVSTREPMAIEFDGEVEGTTDVEFTIVSQALRIAMPAPSPTTAATAE